jgi:hypothetical protein
MPAMGARVTMMSFQTTEVDMIEQPQGAQPGNLVFVNGHRVVAVRRKGDGS